MKNEILSPATQAAHNYAANKLADAYVSALSRATVGQNFPMLAGMAEAFKLEFAQWVYAGGKIRGAHNIKFRQSAVITSAHWEIKRRLEANNSLAQKLVAIRAKQAAKELSEQRADLLKNDSAWFDQATNA